MRLSEFQSIQNLSEYGMSSSGAPTPVGAQGMGTTAKTVAQQRKTDRAPAPSPTTRQQQQPSASPAQQEPVVAPAGELEKDSQFMDPEQNTFTVVSPQGQIDPEIPNDDPNTIVVQDEQGMIYALEPDTQVVVGEIEESVFDRFDSLSLAEQLTIMSKLSHSTINEAWSKKQKKKTFESNKPYFLKPGELSGSWKDSQLKKLGFRQASNGSWYINQTKWNKLLQIGERHWHSLISEREYVDEAVPNNDSEHKLRQVMSQPLLSGDIRSQMTAYIALPDPDMLQHFRRVRAENGDDVDLRDVVKQYMEKLHPRIKARLEQE